MRTFLIATVCIVSLLLMSCQLNNTSEQAFRFGVLSDAQGDATGVEKLANQLVVEDVAFILFLGDANQYGNAVSDVDEMKAVFSALADAGVPVYILPGNHEVKSDYYTAFTAIGSSPLIDLSSGGSFDFPNVDFFVVPGYYRKNFPAENGFVYSSFSFSRKNSSDPLLLLSHGPPTEYGLDRTLEGASVGDPGIAHLIRSSGISFGFFGHIHEAGGIAVDCSGERVPENTWSSCLFLNPGSVVSWQLTSGIGNQGSAAVVEFKDDKMKYSMVVRD